MTTITDEQLVAFGDFAQGKVVVITGGANGIGKETALLFTRYGAKVVIGDRDVKGGAEIVAAIDRNGGQAIFCPCDVLEWNDLVALFESAIQEYGVLDIVVPNAGVNEIGQFHDVVVVDGVPQPPNLRTLDINFTAALNTTYLALHYLQKSPEKSPKAIVLMASMYSWDMLSMAPLYSVSKHGILGLMRSLSTGSETDGIRTITVHPWFVDTGLLPTMIRVALAGLPKASIERIARAVFFAATNTDPKNNGCALLIPDEGLVLCLQAEDMHKGVYETIRGRLAATKRSTNIMTVLMGTIWDVWRIFCVKQLIPLSVTAFGIFALKRTGFS